MASALLRLSQVKLLVTDDSGAETDGVAEAIASIGRRSPQAADYLTSAATALIAWHAAPLATLVAFLCASVWHFGREDPTGRSLHEKLVRGSLPVAMPMLVHPAATVALSTTITDLRLGQLAAPE